MCSHPTSYTLRKEKKIFADGEFMGPCFEVTWMKRCLRRSVRPGKPEPPLGNDRFKEKIEKTLLMKLGYA